MGVCVALLFTVAAFAEDKEAGTLDIDKASYALGVQFGQSIAKLEMGLNNDQIVKGITDMLEGKPSELAEDEVKALMNQLNQKMMAQRRNMQEKEAGQNLEKGKAFLEENAKKEGVKTTASGLQYKVLTAADGKKPTADSTVKVHYAGRLLDGTEFDSSYKRGQPAEFGVGQVIKGWTEALQLMSPGAKFEIYIPSDLAYGEPGRPSIPPNSVLVFEVELLEIL